MTLLTGVALAETLAPMVPSDIVIKWPNDILAGGKKIAGILVESATELDAVQYMIIGVGVNASMPGEAFTGELAGRATSLAEETGTAVDRTRLLCAFLLRLEDLYLRAESDGFGPVIERWRKLAAVDGKHVRVDLGHGSVEGILAGIDDDGLLLLRMPDSSLQKIHSGDIEYLQPWWGKR